MDESRYFYFTGNIIGIQDVRGLSETGCVKKVMLEDGDGNRVDFIVTLRTYFVNGYKMEIGDEITAFYSASAPAPLIYPPQYMAVVVAKTDGEFLIKLDYFDEQLISADGMLQLVPSAETEVILENGQAFNGSLRNRELLVLYRNSTRSIPARTVPFKIVVLCID